MKLVVGLGNPGPEYAETRHNAGFRVVERLAERHRIALRRERRFAGLFGEGNARGVAVGLLEPQTWMNRSGQAVVAAVDALPLGDLASSLVVVYDDLDLPFGRLRVRPGGGAGGHNGLADIQERLGRSDFPRVRFGIGRPPAGADPVDYVLAPFDAEQRAALDAHVGRAADAVEAILVEGVARAMNRHNASRAEEAGA
ncbi:MAG: aminoacyl-tRNA hydrolase [Deltaproteobacteria bacterium]|nr:aminoacyl-tRNA hydrolase [Deltaproteobacteria bacterium]